MCPAGRIFVLCFCHAESMWGEGYVEREGLEVAGEGGIVGENGFLASGDEGVNGSEGHFIINCDKLQNCLKR